MKKYFLIVDTETTQSDMVADFGAVIVDRQGNIAAECGVLVREYYLDREAHPLFHMGDADPLWGKRNLPKRYAAYDAMLANGSRMLASVPAVNSWLTKALAKYKPILTAYNLNFDLGKCRNSGIDLSVFDPQFCLWYASANRWMHTKPYRQFVLDNVAFNNVTKHGNMSFQTKAEVMARFVLNDPGLEDEPHTALEDAKFYELPILKKLVDTTSPRVYLNPRPVTWRDVQVKDWYQPK